MKLLAILPAVLLTVVSTNVAANLSESEADDTMLVKSAAVPITCLIDNKRFTINGNNAALVNTNRNNLSQSACLKTKIAKHQTETNQDGLIVVKSAAAPRNCLKDKQRYTLYGNNAVMVNTNRQNQCKN